MQTLVSSILSTVAAGCVAFCTAALAAAAPVQVEVDDIGEAVESVQAAIVTIHAAQPNAASITLASSAFAVVAPTAVTLTATVSGGTLSGNIVFMDGASNLGSIAIKSAKAVLTTPLPAGIHRVVATYASGATELSSAPVNVVVDNALTCSPPG